MGDVIKIGGNYNNTVKGVSVDSEGAMYVSHGADMIQLFNAFAITDTNVHKPDIAVDLRNTPVVSLRANNTCDKPIQIKFFSDLPNAPNTATLKDATGAEVMITIPANMNGRAVITPDDIPVLPYLQYLNIGLKASTAPTTGSVSIWVCTKR